MTEPMTTEDDIEDVFNLSACLEALVFTAHEPVTMTYLKNRLEDYEETQILQGLQELQEHYAGRGVRLVCKGDRWSFETASELSGLLQNLRNEDRKLSRAAMETLSIIAYHQPVTRAEIEHIRGVAVGKGILDVLIEAGWVKPGKRRDVPGRPLTWVTTVAFLSHFGLETIKDLPGLAEMKAAGLLVDDKSVLQTSSLTSDLFEESEELEEDDNRDMVADNDNTQSLEEED